MKTGAMQPGHLKHGSLRLEQTPQRIKALSEAAKKVQRDKRRGRNVPPELGWGPAK